MLQRPGEFGGLCRRSTLSREPIRRLVHPLCRFKSFFVSLSACGLQWMMGHTLSKLPRPRSIRFGKQQRPSVFNPRDESRVHRCLPEGAAVPHQGFPRRRRPGFERVTDACRYDEEAKDSAQHGPYEIKNGYDCRTATGSGSPGSGSSARLPLGEAWRLALPSAWGGGCSCGDGSRAGEGGGGGRIERERR